MLRDGFANTKMDTLQKRIIIGNPHTYIASTNNKQDVLKRFVEKQNFSGLSFKDTQLAGEYCMMSERACKRGELASPMQALACTTQQELTIEFY